MAKKKNQKKELKKENKRPPKYNQLDLDSDFYKNMCDPIGSLPEEKVSKDYNNIKEIPVIEDKTGLVEQAAKELREEMEPESADELTPEQSQKLRTMNDNTKEAFAEELGQYVDLPNQHDYSGQPEIRQEEAQDFIDEDVAKAPFSSESRQREKSVSQVSKTKADVNERKSNNPINDNDLSYTEEDAEELDADKTTMLGRSKKKKFAILTELTTGLKIEIVSNPFVIGKHSNCDYCIRDNVISRHHAEITQMGNKYFIKDLRSTNGTYIDGYQIPPGSEVEIKNGQKITLANKNFSFHS